MPSPTYFKPKTQIRISEIFSFVIKFFHYPHPLSFLIPLIPPTVPLIPLIPPSVPFIPPI